MESFFASINGLFVYDGTTVALVALGASTLILSGAVLYLNVKIHRLLAGPGAESLEDSLIHIKKNADEQKYFKEEVTEYLKSVEERLRRSTQSIATIRFNAFKGKGGGSNQSFATALIDEGGNGVVISSIQFRDHVGIYAKPIEKYATEFELTGEEKEALMAAKKKIPIKKHAELR